MLHCTDVTALSYSAVSQINCFGILANRPQTYRPTHRGKKAGRRRMEKLPQLALRPDQLPTANLTTSTSNIGNISTPNVHDESKLQLCVLNTQSMCNKSDEFVDFVLQNNLDLVAISETWFKPDDNLVPHECTPAGYSLHHIPRPKKTGGGVALLFRSSLSVSMKNDNIDYLTFESLHAEITCNSRSVRLVNIYRPERDVDGKRVNFSSFLQEFEKLIVNYILHPSDIILTGDFNIHMDNTSNIYANQFKDLLSAHGLIQHITAPTHRYGHCLDLMITRENTSPLISNITVHPGLSDHYAIITDMNLKKPKMPTISVSTRHWKNVNIQDLCFDIESQLENVNLEDGELDSCVNLFESTVRNILDDHAPLKTRTVKLQSESPWFNDDIRAARKTRRQLERKWRDNGKREVHRQEYRKQHDIVKNMINRAKIAHYSSLVEESSGNQKKLFNIVEKLLHKPKTPVLPSAHSDQDLANAFSHFFVTKIENIRRSFPTVSAILSQTQPHKDPHCRLSVFEPTCVTEIKKLIMKSPSKSCELDPVPTLLMKQNIDVFAKYITIIVNRSLSSGCFPDSQKIAHVKPLLKKPN